jgi:hypothetical protein
MDKSGKLKAWRRKRSSAENDIREASSNIPSERPGIDQGVSRYPP